MILTTYASVMKTDLIILCESIGRPNGQKNWTCQSYPYFFLQISRILDVSLTTTTEFYAEPNLKNQKEMSAKICYEKCYVERQFTYFATEVLN